jgi:hypothetical protein
MNNLSIHDQKITFNPLILRGHVQVSVKYPE